MNRQQIEAWLALEGWVPRKRNSASQPIWVKGYVFVMATAGYIDIFDMNESGLRHEYPSAPVISTECWSDEQLQLIYQEIIKHEKD